jgi:hypothetical protein
MPATINFRDITFVTGAVGDIINSERITSYGSSQIPRSGSLQGYEQKIGKECFFFYAKQDKNAETQE